MVAITWFAVLGVAVYAVVVTVAFVRLKRAARRVIAANHQLTHDKVELGAALGTLNAAVERLQAQLGTPLKVARPRLRLYRGIAHDDESNT